MLYLSSTYIDFCVFFYNNILKIFKNNYEMLVKKLKNIFRWYLVDFNDQLLFYYISTFCLWEGGVKIV